MTSTMNPTWARRLLGVGLASLFVGVLGGCGGRGSSEGSDDGGIFIRYIGSPAGVYEAYCFPAKDAPPGRIVEIDEVKKVNLIDATYEYLPDGLKILHPDLAAYPYADCGQYVVKPAYPASVPTTTVPASTSVPPSSTA